MKTLVYHTGALGDFITILPLLRHWKAAHPKGTVVLLGRSAYGRLAVDSGLVTDVWDIDQARWARLFSAEHDLGDDLRASLRDFDTAFVFADDSSPVLSHVRSFGIEHVYSQPPFPPAQTHVAAYHLSMLDGVMPHSGLTVPHVRPHPRDSAVADRLLPQGETVVALHPGSGSARKNWPLQCFYELAGRLAHDGMTPVWLAGPAEHGFDLSAQERVLRNIPLPVLAHILARSRLFVGNDSGVSHLAAAVGCACVVLFGASDPLVWRPAGPRVTVVCNAPECAPCHPAHGVRKCGLECMKAVSVDEVLRAAAKAMNSGNPKR